MLTLLPPVAYLHFLVAAPPEQTSDLLHTLVVPGGVVAGLLVFLGTVLKFRSTDRQNLSGETKDFISQITEERDKAQSDRDALQVRLDAEREVRRKKEDELGQALRTVSALTDQVKELTEQLADLKLKITELTEQIQGMAGGR
jgi:septal ring factor EnvC (AmiA/AmiB activator)